MKSPCSLGERKNELRALTLACLDRVEGIARIDRWAGFLGCVIVLSGVLSGCAMNLGDPGADQEVVIGKSLVMRDPLFSDEALAAELEKYGVPNHSNERGIVVIFAGLSFSTSKAVLTPRAQRTLQHIAGILNRDPVSHRPIIVEGHTDSTGSANYNLVLSTRRAESVARELIFNGVKSDRIRVRGRGEGRPLAPNSLPDGRDNPHGRTKNRRVEIIIARPQLQSAEESGTR